MWGTHTLNKQRILYYMRPPYVLIPLHKNTKTPALKWKKYITARPSPYDTHNWFTTVFPTCDVGLITGALSGVMVADIDIPFADWDDKMIAMFGNRPFVHTPSGGRHIYYKYTEGDKHGLNVLPSVDVPLLVKLYDVPYVITGERIPISGIAPLVTRVGVQFEDDNPPSARNLQNCDFIQHFQQKRPDNSWQNRYSEARSYVSNAIRCEPQDLSCGNDYQHQENIVARIKLPITCRHIFKTYKCAQYDVNTGQCDKSSARTPYGLAKHYQKLEK